MKRSRVGYILFEGIDTEQGGIASWFRGMAIEDAGSPGKRPVVFSRKQVSDRPAGVECKHPGSFFSLLFLVSETRVFNRIMWRLGIGQQDYLYLFFSLFVKSRLLFRWRRFNQFVIPIFSGLPHYFSNELPIEIALISTSEHVTRYQEVIGVQGKAMRRQEKRERSSLKKHKNFIAISHQIANELVFNGQIKANRLMVRTPKIVDPLQRFPEVAQNHRLNPIQRQRNLVFIGRDEERKGFDLLLEFWNELIKVDILRDFRLTIVGALSNRKLPVRCIELPMISELKKFELLQSSFLTIIPSRYESFGIVRIESYAVATPVLFSAVGGLLEGNIDVPSFPGVNFESPLPALEAVISLLDSAHWREVSLASRRIFETKYRLSVTLAD